MTGAKMVSLWNKLFGKKHSHTSSAVARVPRPAIAGDTLSPRLPGGSPMDACRGQLNLLRAPYPAYRHLDPPLAHAPQWFTLLQAHIRAVHANDTAVRLFREGRLEAAITELQRGLEANPHYATGYSN